MDYDEARRSGIGQLYGRVLESQVIELMGLAGGFLGLSAVLELALAVPYSPPAQAVGPMPLCCWPRWARPWRWGYVSDPGTGGPRTG